MKIRTTPDRERDRLISPNDHSRDLARNSKKVPVPAQEKKKKQQQLTTIARWKLTEMLLRLRPSDAKISEVTTVTSSVKELS